MNAAKRVPMFQLHCRDCHAVTLHADNCGDYSECPKCESTDTRSTPARCRFCGRVVQDGKEESGFTGEGPDWCDDGDFGCDDSPETSEEGCGGHAVTDAEVERAENSAEAREAYSERERKEEARANLRRAAPELRRALQAIMGNQLGAGTDLDAQRFKDARSILARTLDVDQEVEA